MEIISANQAFLVDLLIKTLLALLALIVFTIMARVLRDVVKRLTDRASRNVNLPYLLSNLVYVTLLIIGGLVILVIYTGAGLSNLIAVLGFVSLAVSLSLQDLLKNFVSGIYLLLEQPFNIGDRIRVKEFEGKIENIQIRTTNISTDDGLLVYVPNSILFTEAVINKTAYRQRMANVRFVVAPERIDFEEARVKIKKVLDDFASTRVSPKPEPRILVEAASSKEIKAMIMIW